MRLALDDRGTGDAVVLLHAGIADRRMWSEHVAAFAKGGRRAIAPDLPGFGQSPPASDVDAPWVDVLETLDGLGVERFALAGNSFGGAVALRVAALAPARTTGLLLVSAPDDELDPSSRLQAAWDAEEEALGRGDVEGAAEAVVEAWTLPGAESRIRERVREMQRDAFTAQLGAPSAAEGSDPLADGRLPDPGAFPVIVAAGEHDMPDFIDAAARLAGLLGATPPVTIPGAGHLAPLEQPDAFAALLARLLDA